MKSLALILGLLLLPAVAVFYLTTSESNGNLAAQAPPAISKPAKASTHPLGRTDEARKPNASKVPTGIQARSDTDRSLANVSALLAPIQSELVDSRMRTREPRYRALFDSWGLDPESADTVLGIIRDREAKCMQLNLRSFEKGALAMVETKKKKEAEREVAERMLTPLLGPDRYEELARLEDQFLAESRKRGQDMKSKAIKEDKESAR